MSCEDLPPELLVRIFRFYIQSEGPRKFLRNVSAVSTRWRTSSANSALWDEVSLKSLDHNFDHVLKLGERGLLYRTQLLDLSTRSREVKLPKLQPFNFVELTKYCHKVVRLDISNNKISEPAMESMTKAWPGIDQLVMVDVIGIGDDSDSDRHPAPLSTEVLNPVFDVWGKKLRHLDLSYCHFRYGNELISKVADCCPCLEEFYLLHAFCDVQFDSMFRLPVSKFQRGCPKLQVLKLTHCDFVLPDTKDLIGFRQMRKFMVLFCNLNSVDVSLILKNSAELEEIEIYSSNATLSDLVLIPSEKVKILNLRFPGGSTKFLEDSTGKWKKTLVDLAIASFPEIDVTNALKIYLQDNVDLKLEKLTVEACVVELSFLKTLIRACQELKYLEFISKNKERKIFNKLHSRKEVEQVLNW